MVLSCVKQGDSAATAVAFISMFHAEGQGDKTDRRGVSDNIFTVGLNNCTRASQNHLHTQQSVTPYKFQATVSVQSSPDTERPCNWAEAEPLAAVS